jgi:hypothetical protein
MATTPLEEMEARQVDRFWRWAEGFKEWRFDLVEFSPCRNWLDICRRRLSGIARGGGRDDLHVTSSE